MSNTIPTDTVLLASLTMLALAGCDGPARRQQENSRGAPVVTPAPSIGRIDPEPPADETSRVIARRDITVNGEPACALDLRYAGMLDQPVTWRGEPCDAITIRFVTLDELRQMGQDAKLDEEMRDDLSRLPRARALYIEGKAASSLFPANVMQRIYEVPLAD